MPEAAPVIATTLPERVFMRAWYANRPAVRLEPVRSGPRAHVEPRLGDVRDSQADTTAAIAHYERALSREPGYRWVKDVLLPQARGQAPAKPADGGAKP